MGLRHIRFTMNLLLILSGICIAIAAMVGIFAHSRDGAIWFTCAGVVFAVISAFAWFQDTVWEHDRNNNIPKAMPAVSAPFVIPTPTPTPPPDPVSPTPLAATPLPTPVVPPGPSKITLTPTQIFDKMKAAITTQDRRNLAKLCVGQSVDWTLSYFDATPNDEGITLYFVPDKQDSGIVACKVPTKGNERFPFNNPPGQQFRVRGTIEEVTLMYITLTDCVIDPIQPEHPPP